MTDPIDPIDSAPQPPVANQPGAGRLDQPPRHTFGRKVNDPAPGTSEGPATAQAQAAAAPAPGFDQRGHVKTGRVSAVWVGLIATAIFVVLLIIFIAQNSHQASLHFLGWSGQFSLALTILVSAVAGILLVAIPGSVRIAQLRRALRRNGPGHG